jgi:hypothetical protein
MVFEELGKGIALHLFGNSMNGVAEPQIRQALHVVVSSGVGPRPMICPSHCSTATKILVSL